MAQHPSYSLVCPDHQGSLLLTPCPGTLELDLNGALKSLQAAGATAVVTLMTQAEMQNNRVDGLQAQCAALGLHWFHLPVEDEGAPTEEFTQTWKQVRGHIHDRLDNHEAIAIHCKGGSGRTGVVAAQILMERGTPMQVAMDQVKALRPNAFAHAVQVEYMLELAEKL